MRTRTFTLGMLTVLSTAALIFAQAETAASRLDRAREAERTLGPEAAIQIYESILRDFPNDRSNSAKALGQIIREYDLLGDADKRRESCQRLIAQYANQPEVTPDIRNRCAPPARTKPGIFIAEVDPQTGAIRLPVRSFTKDPDADEHGASWAPDGRSLSFRRASGPNQTMTLVRPLEGGTERTVSQCGLALFAKAAWLPDGRSLLLAGGGAGTPGCLGITDLETGALHQQPFPNVPLSRWTILSREGMTLYSAIPTRLGSSILPTVAALELSTLKAKSFFMLPVIEGESPSNGQIIDISPDGRALVLIRQGSSTDARLARVEVDGSSYRELVTGIGQLQNVAWSKDGRRILFARSSGDGNWQMMQVSADGGAPSFAGLEVTGLRFFDVNRDNTQIAFDGTSYTISAPGPRP